MKKIFSIIAIMLFAITVFSQRLRDKDTSALDDNTLFAVQDSVNYYNWRAVDFSTLKTAFNPFEVTNGIYSLKGLSLENDSTHISNILNVGNTYSQNWGYKSNFQMPFGIGDGVTQKSFLQNGLTVSKDINNGILMRGWTFPTPTQNTTNFLIGSHVAFDNDNINDTTGLHKHNAFMQFSVTGDRWEDDYNDWLGNHRIKKHSLFSFYQYEGNTLLTMFDDSVQVHQDFHVIDNSGDKLFSINEDSTVVHNKLVLKNKAWVWDYTYIVGERSAIENDDGFAFGNGNSSTYFQIQDTCFLESIVLNGIVTSDSLMLHFVSQNQGSNANSFQNVLSDTLIFYNTNSLDEIIQLNDIELSPNIGYNLRSLTTGAGEATRLTATFVIRRKQYINFD